MPSVKCEVNLNLRRSENCVITDMTMRAASGDNPEIRAPRSALFHITEAIFYAPAVTLSTPNNTKLLQQLKTGFKRTIICNYYIYHNYYIY